MYAHCNINRFIDKKRYKHANEVYTTDNKRYEEEWEPETFSEFNDIHL